MIKVTHDQVKDIYTIDEDLLHTKADISTYWKTCFNFWEQVKAKKISDITEKQIEWLEKITADLEDAE